MPAPQGQLRKFDENWISGSVQSVLSDLQRFEQFDPDRSALIGTSGEGRVRTNGC